MASGRQPTPTPGSHRFVHRCQVSAPAFVTIRHYFVTIVHHFFRDIGSEIATALPGEAKARATMWLMWTERSAPASHNIGTDWETGATTDAHPADT